MTSAVGGAALCPTRVLWAFLHKSVECPCFRALFAPRSQKVCIFMGLCASRLSNAPCFFVISCARITESMHIYGTLWKQAFECALFCGTFCIEVAESMHIYAVFPPRQQKVCSYLHLYVLFCLVFLSFGAGPMGI